MDKKQTLFEKLKDDVHYLILAHCKYKDMSMYERALKQFQEDINYGQLEEMSYDERFAFLLGFEKSLLTIEEAHLLSEQMIKEKRKTTHEKSVFDILSALPAGSAIATRGDADNTIIIRIKKEIFDKEGEQ